MPTIVSSLSFNTKFEAELGHPTEVAPLIKRVVAPNANPFTFTGTNTYLIGQDHLIIIDPGPDDKQHLAALITAIDNRPVTAILLTHTHKDHSALGNRLSYKLGAALWFGGAHRLSRPRRFLEINPVHGASDWKLLPDKILKHGDKLNFGKFGIDVLATPGHCANHLCFGMRGTPYLFSGDHVMGWSTSLVATPDGSMGDYFRSLQKLIEAPWTHYFPGHGGPISGAAGTPDGRNFARALKKHRELRAQQIVDAVAGGACSTGEIAKQLYPGVGIQIGVAARMTIAAHVELLEQQGRLKVKRGFFRKTRFEVAKN